MGGQVRINLSMDEDVVKKAKQIGLNLSKTCENCLKQAIKALESTHPQKNPDLFMRIGVFISQVMAASWLGFASYIIKALLT